MIKFFDENYGEALDERLKENGDKEESSDDEDEEMED
jgi:hypothetical protein